MTAIKKVRLPSDSTKRYLSTELLPDPLSLPLLPVVIYQVQDGIFKLAQETFSL